MPNAAVTLVSSTMGDCISPDTGEPVELATAEVALVKDAMLLLDAVELAGVADAAFKAADTEETARESVVVRLASVDDITVRSVDCVAAGLPRYPERAKHPYRAMHSRRQGRKCLLRANSSK